MQTRNQGVKPIAVESTYGAGRKRALVLHGGWEGHTPDVIADAAVADVLGEFDVVRSRSLEDLRDEVLNDVDLLVPIWTFGEIAPEQESALLRAVEGGMGILAWHGATSAFLHSRLHKFMLGGQFVGHPGGDTVTYTVEFLNNDPLVHGLSPITLTSEQYYMLVDPAVKVLAQTTMVADGMEWIAGIKAPVAWRRRWGRGRVFYCSIGHTLEDFRIPTFQTLLKRAAVWTSQGSRVKP